MKTKRFSRRPLATAIVCALGSAGTAPLAFAQAQPAPAPTTLPAVTVTGNPLGTSELTVPVTTLSGDALVFLIVSSVG